MSDRKLFLLLDIDGVLLEAHGYRLACIDTINDFLRLMGQPDLMIRRDITDAFEAAGIGAEWDIVPLALAAFANWYYQQTGEIAENTAFPPRCDSIHLCDNDAFRQMLLEQIREYAALLSPDMTAMDAIGKAYAEGRCAGMQALRKQPFFRRFFFETLSPRACPFFAGLMNRLLGSAVFSSFFGMEAPFRTESYLETKDKLIISEHYRQLLPELAGKSIFPAVMTYRPTLFPMIDGNKGSHYFVNTPEGECALRLLGWTDERIPMIGGGSLSYIEEKYHLRREYYVKPHPFHAMASLLRAVCESETEALETARLLCELDPEKDSDPAANVLPPGEKLSLMVFEDSVSGIMSLKNAAAVLRSWGYDVQSRYCGICSTNEKTDLLGAAGAELYPDINSALDSVPDQSFYGKVL